MKLEAGFLPQFDKDTLVSQTKGLTKGSLGIPILLLAVLAMMTLPVPPFVLDVLFTFNITIALVVLCVGVYSMRPLDFSVFPTILLVATLLRLSLNVASTRVVLLNGHQGGDAAGKVIEAFGEVVISGNYTVGFIVFIILMIINFVVVTKGAGRIAEVSARFTLDAMPGKQMAIDADLNAGIIEQDQAKKRREEISQEADFYGAMDGASKFVKGDAIAGILILLINIIGGLLIGTMQHDLEFSDAMQKYTLLTIGDGLIAQIPALLLSTAAAIMVTRNNSSQMVGEQVISQMFDTPKALGIAASILFLMGIVPGMPHFSFLSLAILAAIGAYMISRGKQITLNRIEEEKQAADVANKLPAENKELDWEDVTPVDMIGLEVGYRLIPMVDKSQGGELLGRIKGIRKKLSQDLGFLVPSVHIRDNLDLQPNAYRISLMGVTVGEADVYPERDLAINPGQVFGDLQGIEGKDPAFGLDAIWIEAAQNDQAQTLGYTVVDASTVIATHLNTLLQKHAYELLGHEEVQQLLERLAKTSPKLAEELVPNTLTLNELLKVLQNLLIEAVSIRDMRTIAEALTTTGLKSPGPSVLTVAARIALARVIVQSIVGTNAELPVITLEPALEQLLLRTVQQSVQSGHGNEEDIILEPLMAERLQKSLVDASQRQELAGNPSVLLVSGPLRIFLSRFVRYTIPEMHVLSYQEVPDNKKITIVATVGQQDALQRNEK